MRRFPRSRVLVPAVLALSCLAAACAERRAEAPPPPGPAWSLAIHGGAGTIRRVDLDAQEEQDYRAALATALQTGGDVLEAGGSSLDAVEAVIRFMEDSPLFNAGRGAVFTAEGANELDASIMDGRDRDAGAVAGVRTVRHPITAARRVMDASPHVMLSGAGADAFAAAQGVEQADPAWFRTEARWQSYLRAKARADSTAAAEDPDRKHGTVGCVARDRDGHLAAGTSTGGMTFKRWGRVGDAPIIGAGTWADDRTCAVSATGHGEYFIRNVVAYDIAALMEYRGLSLQAAADSVIHGKLTPQGATGGVVALDRDGRAVMVFNTAGMYRGSLAAGGAPQVSIYSPELPD